MSVGVKIMKGGSIDSELFFILEHFLNYVNCIDRTNLCIYENNLSFSFSKYPGFRTQ